MYYIFASMPPAFQLRRIRSFFARTPPSFLLRRIRSFFARTPPSFLLRRIRSFFARTPPSIRNHVCSLRSHTHRTSCWITHVGRDSCFAGIICIYKPSLTCKHDDPDYIYIFLANRNLKNQSPPCISCILRPSGRS